MSLQGSAKTDIKLEAVNAYFGTERCRGITFVDDVSGSLSGEYFDLNAINSDLETSTNYYVLLDDGSAIDPAPAGKTLISVSYSADDTAEVIASAFASAFGSLDFTTEVSGSTVIVENAYIGGVSDEDQSNAPSLTFEELSVGKGGSLGATAQGGSTLNMEAQSVDLVSDQTGSIIQGQVYTGSTASIDMTLIEMDKERWEAVIGTVTGDEFTPSAGGSTRLVGYGESRLYQNLFDLGGKLILHPIRLPNSDKSEDIIFWKSAPLPSSIQYSGQDIQGMEVSFVAYNDSNKPSEISLFAQGDWDQELG